MRLQIQPIHCESYGVRSRLNFVQHPATPAEDLASDVAIVTFIAEASKTKDASYVAHALGAVARARASASN